MFAGARKPFAWAWNRWRGTNRLLVLLLGAALGIAAGLAYAYWFNPAQYTETVPSQLEPQYQAEFVMMVAETYEREKDLHAASARLSGLGRSDMSALVRDVERAYAVAGYPQTDLDRLERLARDLEPVSIQPQVSP